MDEVRNVRFQILMAEQMIDLLEGELGLEKGPDGLSCKLFIGTPAGNRPVDYQHPNHFGDVISYGDGETIISLGAVTNGKMANMPNGTFKGRMFVDGPPQDLTITDVKSMLGLEDSIISAIHPGVGVNVTDVNGVVTVALKQPSDITSTSINNATVDTHTHALNATGVEPGIYRSLTVDGKGRVTGGTNPTTLSEYGIIDAVSKSGDTLSGPLILHGIPDNPLEAANKQYVDTSTTNISNSKLSNMPVNTLKGRRGTPGAPEDLTTAQVRTMLDVPVPSNLQPNSVAVGGLNSPGTSSDYARIDHVHAMQNISDSLVVGDGLVGTVTEDVTSLSLGRPTTLTPETQNAVTTTSHTHQVAGFEPIISRNSAFNLSLSITPGGQLIPGAEGAVGESLTHISRADHTHTLPQYPEGNYTHTGDVAGNHELAINANAVTNAKLAKMGPMTIKGNNESSSHDPKDLSIEAIQDLIVTPLASDRVSGTLVAGGAGATGVLDEYARVDHIHPMPPFPAEVAHTGDVTGLTALTISSNVIDDYHLIDSAITSQKIRDGAVIETKLGLGSVTETKIAGNAVTGHKLADDSVSTSKIATGAVTDVKLAASSVTTAKIAIGAVVESSIADYAVTNYKLADDSVDINKIIDGSVNNQKLALNSVSNLNILDNAVTTLKIADMAVGNSKMNTMAANTIKGRYVTSGVPEDLSVSNVKTMLGIPTFTLVGTTLTITLS